MVQTIAEVNKTLNDLVWGVPAMALILGVGLFLSFATRFLQLRRFGYAMRQTVGRVFSKDRAGDGAVTPFQAVCTALAATVGTGNIAGVAGAIAMGGPGAVFWMWVSALFGMCTKFSEVTLAVHFRERNAAGDWVGGPMYFMKNGLGRRWMPLAWIFCALGVLTVFGTGCATQVNTIVTAVNSALYNFGAGPEKGTPMMNLLIGVALAIAIGVILLGGIKRIGRVTERLVPFMALMYVALALGVVAMHIGSVPGVLRAIVQGAFTPAAFTGGVIGSMFIAMQRGVSRGIFSNEAGLGTASIAHASAEIDSPVRQGLFGIFEVFTDTFLVCTLTALVVLTSGVSIPYGMAAGAELTISGFTSTYGGWVSLLTAVAMCCFAFSTILGWGLYGSRCLEFLCGSRSHKPFLVVYALVAVLGATADLGLLWDIADTCNGLMAIPNLIAVALLSPVVFRLVREYFQPEKG